MIDAPVMSEVHGNLLVIPRIGCDGLRCHQCVQMLCKARRDSASSEQHAKFHVSLHGSRRKIRTRHKSKPTVRHHTFRMYSHRTDCAFAFPRL